MNELLKLNGEELADRLGQTDRYNEMFCILMVLRKKGYEIKSLIEKIIAPLKDKRLISEFRLLLLMSEKSALFRFSLNEMPEEKVIINIKKNPNLSFYIFKPSFRVIFTVLKRDESFKKYFSTDLLNKINDITDQAQLAILSEEPELIKHIKNHSEQFLFEAVKVNPMVIRYLSDPSEAVQLAAVRENGLVIQYLKAPSVNVKVKAIENNYKAVQFIDNITEIYQISNKQEIYAFMVKNNGLKIQQIVDPSEEIQRLAIQENGCSIQYIENPSISIQIEAVAKDSMAIRYIDNPSEEVMLESIKNDPFSIQYIKNPPIEVVLEAVRLDGETIKYFEDPPVNIQLEAVRQSEFAIRYIENPIPEVQMESVRSNPASIAFIKNFDQASFDLYSSTKVVEHDILTGEERAEFKPPYTDKLKDILTENCENLIIDWQDNLCDHINFLCHEFEVQHIKIATGFTLRSGLELISPSFQRALNNQGTIELVIGSLQKYHGDPNKKVMGMDVATAHYINDLIGKGINLRSFKNSFYHGKFYWLEGEAFTSIIIGSSNVSVSGFKNNRELNLLFLFSNISAKYQEFKNWFKRLWQECEEIGLLDPQCFSSLERDYHYRESSNIIRVNENDVRQKLKTLSDKEVVARMRLWLSKKPNNIYSDLEIDNLKDYLLFEYKDYDLIVFETMTPGNAYYYFYKHEVNSLIKLLKQASKTEIFNLSQMHKRGYHIQNSVNLEIAINNLFIKSYQNIKEA